jgi:hypothetical protein
LRQFFLGLRPSGAFESARTLARALLTRSGSAVAPSEWIAVVLAAILLGLGYLYKGPAAIIDSAVAGLILGAATCCRATIFRRLFWLTA